MLCLALAIVIACCALKADARKHLAPEQVHLALYGADNSGYSTGMQVTWYVVDEPLGCTVEFGLSSYALNESTQGTWTQYYDGYHCSAVMNNLHGSSLYDYRVGSSGDAVWSQRFQFKAAPRTADAEFTMSVFGDLGYMSSEERPMLIWTDGLVRHWDASHSRKQLELLKDMGAIDFVWHLGDIGYVDDEFAHNPSGICRRSEEFSLANCYETTYNGFMNWMQNITSIMPYMVSPGNHESECHSPACIMDSHVGRALRNFSAYNHRWRMPSASSNGVLNMWYSFNYGPAHIVSINTETDFEGAEEEGTGDSHFKRFPAGSFAPKGEYLRWLEEDLRKAQSDRTSRPWVILGGHRPISDLLGTPGGNATVALMRKYGVDLYVAGHAHSYSRFAPKCSSSVDGHECLTEIVCGGAGCDEMPMKQVRGTAQGPGVFYTERMATGVLKVTQSVLHWKLIDSYSGSILDQVNLTYRSWGDIQTFI